MATFIILATCKFLTLWAALFFGATWITTYRGNEAVPALHSAMLFGAIAGFITLTLLI